MKFALLTTNLTGGPHTVYADLVHGRLLGTSVIGIGMVDQPGRRMIERTRMARRRQTVVKGDHRRVEGAHDVRRPGEVSA